MIREDPVLVLMTPRSGSSLLAHIFIEHGLWAGDTDPVPRKGYLTYENVALNRLLADLPRDRTTGALELLEPPTSAQRAKIRRVFEQVVPDATPWMLKTNIRNWPALWDLFTMPRLVFSYRPAAAIIQSLEEKADDSHNTPAKRRHRRQHVHQRQQLMIALANDHGIPLVDMDALVHGDLTTLKEAFDQFNLQLKEELVSRCIEPSLWRH